MLQVIVIGFVDVVFINSLDLFQDNVVFLFIYYDGYVGRIIFILSGEWCDDDGVQMVVYFIGGDNDIGMNFMCFIVYCRFQIYDYNLVLMIISF